MRLSSSVLSTMRGSLAGATLVIATGCGGASAPVETAPARSPETPIVAANTQQAPAINTTPPIVNQIDPPATQPPVPVDCGRG